MIADSSLLVMIDSSCWLQQFSRTIPHKECAVRIACIAARRSLFGIVRNKANYNYTIFCTALEVWTVQKSKQFHVNSLWEIWLFFVVTGKRVVLYNETRRKQEEMNYEIHQSH
jgi:hypothetical protein